MAAWTNIVTDTYPVPVAGRGSQRSAFGQLLVDQLTPIAGWTFPFNQVNDRIVVSSASGAGAAVTVTNGRAVIASGTASNGTASIRSRRPLRYVNGVGARAVVACLFSTPQASSTIIVGVGDANDGFFFGYNGTSFGVLRRAAGVDTWTAQADWDDNPASWDLPFDPAKGNVYAISYQWLGFGEIRFFIVDPTSGSFRQVHRIQFANANTETSIRNPQLPLTATATNAGNTTPVSISTASGMGFHEGHVPLEVNAIPHTATATKAGITTEVPVLSIRAESTHNSVANRATVDLRGISIYGEGTGTNPVTWRLRLNPSSLTGPSWAAVSSTASVVDVDTAASALTGGEVLWAQNRARNSGDWLDLASLGIFLVAGDVLTLTCASASSITANAALNWLEEW